MVIFKLSGALTFQKLKKSYLKTCFQTADLAYLNWNDKAKTKEANLFIISIKYQYRSCVTYMRVKRIFLQENNLKILILKSKSEK